MIGSIKRLACNCSGATAVEYGIIVAVLSVAIIVALDAIGISLVAMLGEVVNATDSGAGN